MTLLCVSWRDELLLRFLRHVEFRDDCWLWVGALRGGNQHRDGTAVYGVMSVYGQLIYAHHVAHELFVEPTLGLLGLDTVDHTHECRLGRCVRPDRLRRLSLSDNSRDGALRLAADGSGGAWLEDLF